MAGNSNQKVVREAARALDQFKHEIANELGLQSWQQATQQGGYYGYVPSRDNGAVGGHMVRRMIEAAERSLVEQAYGQLNQSFAQGYTQAAQSVSQDAGYQSQNQSQFQNQNAGFSNQNFFQQGPSVGSPNTTINSSK